jgi:hypothetical protein
MTPLQLAARSGRFLLAVLAVTVGICAVIVIGLALGLQRWARVALFAAYWVAVFGPLWWIARQRRRR